MDLLRKGGVDDPEFLREGVRILAQGLMELARWLRRSALKRYERSDERTIYGNGYRDRVLETRVGRVDLKIPKLREGSYFPSMLEPRLRAEKALVSVIIGSSTSTVLE